MTNIENTARAAKLAKRLPKSDVDASQPLYLRIGDWDPKSPNSRNYALGTIEAGLSVYELDENSKPVVPPTGAWAAEDLADRLSGDLPKYLVQGDLRGVGGDGEPLLSNPKVVGYFDK
jgi:hypothetical protein